MTGYAGLVGLIVGSYLNVVVYRLPRGLSTVRPHSRCPACGEPVRARDNIPVVGYLLLKGRCRDCGTTISWRYPAVEATTGLLFAACHRVFGSTPSALVAMLFCALLLALALIDFDHLILPNRITYPGIVLGLATSWIVDWTSPASALAGAFGGAALLLGLIGIWYLVRGELGMGLGDPKMLAMIGAFLGLSSMLACLFISALLGSAIGIIELLRGRAGLRTKLPFGVFLAAAGMVTLFFGPGLVQGYLGLFGP